jgi:hypothetical protein
MGNFDEPLKISTFVKDVFAGFSMVDPLYLAKFAFDDGHLAQFEE